MRTDPDRLALLGTAAALIVLLANAPTVFLLARTFGEAVWIPWAVWALFVIGFLALLLRRWVRHRSR